MQETGPQYAVSFLTPEEVERSPGVIAAWKELLCRSNNLFRLYQSPAWWDNLGLVCKMPRRLAVVRDAKDAGVPPLSGSPAKAGAPTAVVGIVPLQIGIRELPFEFGKRTIWRTRFNTIFILGSQPLLPEDENVYRQVFRSLWQAFPDCGSIYFKSLMKESWCWRLFEAAKARSDEDYFLYAGEEVRPFHTITLPRVFDEYLEKFSSRRRKEFRKKMKTLEEHGGGCLQLERIDSVEQIDHFLDVARRLFEHSWKARCSRSCLEGGKPGLEDLREREFSAPTCCAAERPTVPRSSATSSGTCITFSRTHTIPPSTGTPPAW